MDALGHSWNEGEVTTEPTVDAEGVLTYTCSVCGETKTEVIPVLEAKFENGLYTEGGKPVPYKGMIEWDGNYYYIGDHGKVMTGRYYTRNMGTTGLTPGYYVFDETTGAMIVGQATVVDGYYYDENGQTVSYAGMVKVGEDYYYVQGMGKVATGMYYVSRVHNAPECATGHYLFGEDGKWLNTTTTIVDGTYYYENGVRKNYAGLVLIDGNYYYVAGSSKIVKNNAKFYVNNTNGLTKGETAIKRGYYAIDANGIVDIK